MRTYVVRNQLTCRVRFKDQKTLNIFSTIFENCRRIDLKQSGHLNIILSLLLYLLIKKNVLTLF